MGALTTFGQLIDDAVANGGGSKELNQKRADLFKNEVLPKLLKLGANKSTIQQAANVWNARTQDMLMRAGMAPTQEQLDDADGGGSAAMNIARGRRREEQQLAASAKKSGAGQTLDAAAHGLGAVVNRLQGGLQSGIAGTAGLLNGWVNKDANGVIDRNTALGRLEREARVLADESRRRGGAGLADHSTGTFAGDLWANTQDMAGSLAESSPSMALGGVAGKGAQLGLYALGMGKTAQLVGAGLASGATEVPMNYEDAHSSQVADLNAVKRDGSYVIPNAALAAHVPVFNLVKQTELAKGVSEEDAEASARIAAIDQASHNSSVKGALMASVFSVIAPSAGSLAAARAVERQAAGKQMGRLGNYLANSARLGDNALTETRAAQAVAGQRYTGLGLSQLKPYGKLAVKEGAEEAAQQMGMNYFNEDKRAEVSGQAFRPGTLTKDLASSFVAGAVMGPTMGVATQGTQQMQDARQIRAMASRTDQLNAQLRREQARATAFDNQTMSQNWTAEQLAARQEQSQESAERLQKLGDALNQHVSTMRDLGLNPDGTLFKPTTRDQQQGVSAFQDAVDSINPVTPDAVTGTATPFNPTSGDIDAAFTQSATNPSGAATYPVSSSTAIQQPDVPQQTGLTGIANRAAASAESAIADPASVMPETITQAPAAPTLLPDAPKGHAIEEVPVDQIQQSDDMPQFKSGANAEGVVEPLGGKFDRTGVAPIQLWRRTNGRLEVISGRHRLDLARRSGETTIPSQIHNEADGFTANHAGILDAEHNIRDGQGKVQDYVDYFKHTGLSQETAESRGLLARATGQRAYSIATRGTDALIAGLRAGILSEKTATEIAEAAPNNEGLQAVGIKAVQDGKSGALAVNLIHAVNAARQDKAPDDTTGDMFGFDDSAMRELEQMARYAGQRQQDISANLNAIRGAAKNPALAKKHGVDVNDPDGLNKKIAELTQEKARWAEWHKHPDLMAQVRERVGQSVVEPAPAVAAVPAPADTPDAGPDMFDLSPHSEQDVKDREDAQAAAKQKKEQEAERQKAQDDANDFVLTGSDRKVDQLEARGQGSLLDFGGNAIDATPSKKPTPAPTENGVLDGDILTASGKPFANRNAANLQIGKRGLKNTHEVVKVGPSAFVVRPRQQQAEDAASESVEQEAPPTKDVATKPNQVSITQMPHPAGGGKQIWNVAVEGAIPDSAHEWAKETSRQMGGTTRSDMGWPGGYSFASNDLAKTFARRMSAKLRNVAKKEAAPDTASTVSDARQNVSVAEEAKAGSSTTIEPFEHVGLKIRPYRHRAGGEIKDGWLVQTPENAEREARGERQIGGDRILDSREAAIRAAEQMASLHQETKAFMAGFAQEEQEAKAAEEARKESNRGKTLAERRADAVLDKPTNLPRSLGLGAGTRREAMQRAVEEGRLILEVMVQDTAAKKRDEAAVSRVHASGYMLGLSNPNIPIVKAGLEAQARLKENKYEKPEYRVYAGQSKDDNFVEISKTEYDYALRLKADIQHSKQPATDAPAKTEAVKRAERRMVNLRKQASGRKLTPGQRQRLEEKIKQAQQEKEAAESKPKSAASPDDVGSQWDALSTEEQRLLVRGRFSYDAASAVAGKKWGELSASGQKTVADAVDTATLLVRALTSGVVSPVEYPTAEAEKSFEHISQSPKSGAYAVRNAFLEAVQREYEAAAPLAETQEQKDALASAIDNFKAQYLQHDAAVMAARSNSYSGVVAGRDKLNIKQVAQRGNALDRQQDALQKWLNGATGSVKRAVIAARSPEQWAAEKQAIADKAAKILAQKEELIAKLLDFKTGDTVKFGSRNVVRVSKGRDGYPSSVTVDGTGLTDNKFDLAKTLFDGDTAKLREVVDAVRAKQNAAPEVGQAASALPQGSSGQKYTGPADVSTRDGQMELANRAATIAALKGMNAQLRAIAPEEAWADANIEEATDLDALRTTISEALVKAQRVDQAAPNEALRKRLEEAAGEELKAVFDVLNLAGARMSHSERVNALLAEDAQEVSDALDRVVADRKNPSPAPAKGAADSGIRFSRRAGGEAEAKRQFAETEQTYGGQAAYERAKAAGQTKLNYRQWIQVRTPNFKAWFGDWENDPANASKVVDPDTGEPMVVYHGTNAQFNAFDREKLGWNTFSNANDIGRAATSAVGHWFNTEPVGDQMGADNHIAAFLNIRSMAEYDSVDDLADTLRDIAPTDYEDTAEISHAVDQWVDEQKDEGFDGLQLPDEEFGNESFVVFDSNQIKSATDNTGEFSADNPDIRYSRRQGPQPFEELPEGRMYHAAQRAGQALSRLNTQFHLALQNPRFARVFNLIQAKLNHVVSETYACVQAAPDLLGRHDSFGDYLKLWSNVFHHKRNAQDHAAAAKALFDGTLIDQMVYTDQELRDIHQLTDTQIGLYRQARAAIDISLDQTVRGTILKIGLNASMPFERVQALLDQDMSYQDAQDEVIRYLEDRVADATADLRNLQQIGASPMEISKAQKKEQQLELSLEESRKRIGEMVKQRAYMEQTGYAPLMRFGQFWVNAYDDKGELAGHWRFESKRERDQAYNAMGRNGIKVSAGEDNPDSYKLYQGVSPETVAMFMQKSGLPLTDVEQEYFKLATANHSALRRKIHRKGYAGYSEDLSRVLSAFVLSNARYTVNQLYGSGSTGEIHAAVADTESTGGWQQRAQKLANYCDDTQEELSWWRNVMFHINMGFSIGFGLVNLTQPITQTLPFLTQERGWGAVKDLSYGLKVAMTSLAGKALPSQYQPLYLRAQKEGHLDPANVWQLQGRERGRSGVNHNFLSALSGASSSIAQVTETVNRRATFFAALKATESMTPEQIAQYGSAYDYAVRAVQETQGIYNKGNRPMLSRGNVGSLFMMFKQYSIAYVEHLWRHFKHPKWRGEKDPFRRAFLLMLGMLWSIAGTMGLPFAQNIADMAQLVGAPLHGVHPERWLRDHLGRGLSDAIQYGPLNAFGLTDISGRTGMGNLVPGTKLLDPATFDSTNRGGVADGVGSLGGPLGGYVAKAGQGLSALFEGDFANAAAFVSPRAIGDAVKGVSAATTGEFKTNSGKTFITDVTPLEAAAKTLGLQPRRFVAAQRDQSGMYQQKASQARAEARFKDRYKEALQAHDDNEMRAIAREIHQWNIENPELRVSFKRSDVAKSIREDKKPWQERMSVPKEIRKSAEYWTQ